ncbi:TrmB family transcriptional regulator [Haloferacaceae archaeon DSL9]
MDDTSLADLLSRFGFSAKEIDTYLALLAHGEAKASTIADHAGVSKRYVYSVSEALEERGFVQVNDHVVPTIIKALPPETVIAKLTGDIESMQPALEERYSQTAPETEQFEVLKARVTVFKRIRTLLDNATNEVALSIPSSRLGEVADELRAAVDRGVFVLLIVSGTDEPPEDATSLASVVRVWSEPMPVMLAVDDRAGILAPSEMIFRSDSGIQALVVVQEQLASVIIGSFLGNYWPVTREVAVTEPDPLPSAYTDFRRAAFQATLHHRTGTDLSVELTGRTTQTNEPTTTEGTVIDIAQGIVEPTNNRFPIEHSLTIETPSGVYTVGGPGAFVEDLEAHEITLRPN